ncbi:DMT family transporter [Dongia sedimenti]|uniref:DMT family transporter n=1 Tax=Dongia sedimenti TaxID=3064282 RepID=A0ABU0YI03_9PROT|nr:DMT family transporter [Rhodospirillaceae bacterium R-7]
MSPSSGSESATATAADLQKTYLAGIGTVLLATLAWSFSGVFTRLLTTDIWTAIAWRSFFGGLFLLIPYIAMNGRRSLSVLLKIGRPGILFVLCQVICQACTVGGLYFTSVANVTVIYATSPFLAAGLAWWLLREKMRGRTIAAGLVSMAGIFIIVAGSVGGGHLLGDLLAIGMTVSFAFIIVIPRARRELPLLPTTVVSAFATALIFAPFSSPAALDLHNWSVLAGFGLTNFSVALFLFVFGARRVSAAEAALIGTLEIVFAPLWVWMMFAERPANTTLIGGALVLAVIVWHTYRDLRDPRGA